MITYQKLWDLLEKKGISQYKLVNEYNYSNLTLHKLRHNGNVTVYSIERLCDILDCQPGDIMENLPANQVKSKSPAEKTRTSKGS